jgi:hypothetical protein
VLRFLLHDHVVEESIASVSHENHAWNDGRSMRDRMLTGDLYIADDPQLAVESLRAATLVNKFNTSDPSEPQARRAILQELFGFLGEGAEVRPPVQCDYGYQIHIGARTFINFGAVLFGRRPDHYRRGCAGRAERPVLDAHPSSGA